VLKEREVRERSALILREFGYGFGLANSHTIEVLRAFTRVAMHYLMISLEAADVSNPQTDSAFYEAVTSLPAFQPEPTTAAWWRISDPVQVRVNHQDREGRYYSTARVIVPKTELKVPEADIAKYPGVPFKKAFDYEARWRYALPQMVQRASLNTASSPATWDDDNFWLWEVSD
jgi:hypothetical protein